MNDRPSAPVVVKVTHHTIELQWEQIRSQDKNRPRHQRLFDEEGTAFPGTLITLHQRERKNNSIWESIYTGSALGFKIENLTPYTKYEYKVQWKSGKSAERSEWSPTVIVSTESEPMNGETIFKAIQIPGKDQLEKLLNTLGPGNSLLEHPNKDGNYPLMQACTKLDINKVELLISAGADVNNTITTGRTALMVAASAGFSKACKLLLENNANIYAIDQNGMSILHHAIDSKHFETVDVIVQYLNQEPDESIRNFEMNREVGIHKWSPLYRAVIHDCSKQIIELLLNNGAEAQCHDRTTGTTALQMAVIRGNLNTTQLLVEHGANVRAISKAAGKTLQELAATTNRMDLINYVDSLQHASRT